MKSCGRVREADCKMREKKGWTLLMHDTPDYNGIDEPSTDAFFFELDWKDFLREIREDVDSFFEYPDGCPDDSRQADREYKAMWKKLSEEREFGADERRVELVLGTALVRETRSPQIAEIFPLGPRAGIEKRLVSAKKIPAPQSYKELSGATTKKKQGAATP